MALRTGALAAAAAVGAQCMPWPEASHHALVRVCVEEHIAVSPERMWDVVTGAERIDDRQENVGALLLDSIPPHPRTGQITEYHSRGPRKVEGELVVALAQNPTALNGQEGVLVLFDLGRRKHRLCVHVLPSTSASSDGCVLRWNEQVESETTDTTPAAMLRAYYSARLGIRDKVSYLVQVAVRNASGGIAGFRGRRERKESWRGRPQRSRRSKSQKKKRPRTLKDAHMPDHAHARKYALQFQLMDEALPSVASLLPVARAAVADLKLLANGMERFFASLACCVRTIALLFDKITACARSGWLLNPQWALLWMPSLYVLFCSNLSEFLAQEHLECFRFVKEYIENTRELITQYSALSFVTDPEPHWVKGFRAMCQSGLQGEKGKVSAMTHGVATLISHDVPRALAAVYIRFVRASSDGERAWMECTGDYLSLKWVWHDAIENVFCPRPNSGARSLLWLWPLAASAGPATSASRISDTIYCIWRESFPKYYYHVSVGDLLRSTATLHSKL